MKSFVKKIYVVTLLAGKGMKFDIDKIRTSNIFTVDELKTLRPVSRGEGLQWHTSLQTSLTDDDYAEIFKDVVISAEKK